MMERYPSKSALDKLKQKPYQLRYQETVGEKNE